MHWCYQWGCYATSAFLSVTLWVCVISQCTLVNGSGVNDRQLLLLCHDDVTLVLLNVILKLQFSSWFNIFWDQDNNKQKCIHLKNKGFHTYSLFALGLISEGVATFLHFSFDTVWVQTVKSQANKCLTKSHVEAVTTFIGQESPGFYSPRTESLFLLW